MTLRLTGFTTTWLVLTIVPAFLGGCVTAAVRGWRSTLLDAVPIAKSAALPGFVTVALGPLAWFLPWSAGDARVATLASFVLLSMMAAHSALGTRLGRELTRWGFVLWWCFGFWALGRLL